MNYFAMATETNHRPASEQLPLRELVKADGTVLGPDDELCLVTRTFQGGELASEARLALNGPKESSGATWQTHTRWSPVKGREGCFDLEVTVQLVSGEAKQTAVAVSVNFSNWDRQAYVLMPGIVYAGNRFDILPMEYPPLIREKEKFPAGYANTHDRTTALEQGRKSGSNQSGHGLCDNSGHGVLRFCRAWVSDAHPST